MHQILGAVDVDGEAALRYSSVTDAPPIRSMIAAVWNTVSMPGDGRGDVVDLGDVALDTSEPRMCGQRGRRPVERADLVSAVEQLGHQVGADEAGASGDQDPAEFSGQ